MSKQKKKKLQNKKAVKYKRKGCAVFRGATPPPPTCKVIIFSIIMFRYRQFLSEYSVLEHPFFYQWNAEYQQFLIFFIVDDVPVVSSQSAAAFTCE